MIITNLIVTAYCCKVCCGPAASGITASGVKPVQGITVAASRQYKLGTKLTIQGYTNRFVIQDRLARRFDNRVDVYFKDHQKAKEFGKQRLTVTIYK